MDDRIWGFVLIAIGFAMIALHPWPERNKSTQPAFLYGFAIGS